MDGLEVIAVFVYLALEKLYCISLVVLLLLLRDVFELHHHQKKG